jgi:hypothetical protein
MILLIVLVVAVLVGLIRGGAIQRLGGLTLRQGGWALTALVLQSVIIYSPWLGQQKARDVFIGAMLLSYLLLFLFVWLNRRLLGIVVIGLGLLLNLVVILANGGYMPTSPEVLQRGGYRASSPIVSGTRLAKSKDIILRREETRLWFLSDALVIPPPFPWPTVFSVGDIVIAAGTFILVQQGMVGASRVAATY